MKNLLKGVLAVGTALVAGYAIYKKVKEHKHEVENNEEIIIDEETQELTQEQQELHDVLVESVTNQMKPYMRKARILKFVRVIVGVFVTANIGIHLACLEAERRVNSTKEGVVAC